MAEIDDLHVEWRVIARLRELLNRPPEADHDVTLTYALFTAILCWTCQRIRDGDRPLAIWTNLQLELAAAQPWGVLELLSKEARDPSSGKVRGGPLETLPASVFLVGLRNATAHGDDRTVSALHTGTSGRADRRLVGFRFDAVFFAPGQSHTREPPRWGCWQLSLTKVDMRRIGLALAERFCNQLGGDARSDAERHVLVA